MPIFQLDKLGSTITSGDMSVGWTESGGMAVAFYRLPKGYDPAPHYRGLPDDMCPCSHWGYIIKGRIRMRTDNGVEVLEQGHAFHLTPGHLGEVLEDTEMIEFTPAEEYKRKNEHVARNVEKLTSATERRTHG